ncbi:MAG: hypothetical protein F6K18_12835 [Okeania sp. SIO2C2]|uniref:hypothetical protein n=1 Tax=Okeania sp. SIO2C2 TaxID=2607787 RepID=UPI0013B69D63|nr:hypothetical protein [Okeania sp. SIO2C2]NEP87630.1 hypothetical protein [Okeania sp. SIO2C2]
MNFRLISYIFGITNSSYQLKYEDKFRVIDLSESSAVKPSFSDRFFHTFTDN